MSDSKNVEPMPYEARRWCSGDQEWTNWQPCTAEKFREYQSRCDDSIQTRVSPAWAKWRDKR